MATPKRIPLIEALNTRGINALSNFQTLDAFAQNCLFVPIKDSLQKLQRVYIEKRPGFAFGTSLTNLITGQQTYWWGAANSNNGSVIHAGLNSSLNAVILIENTVIKNYADGNLIKYFTDTTDPAGKPFLTWTRPVSSEVWGYADTSTAIQITSVPVSTVGRIEHMDGWSFIGTKLPARIYNSNLNDPTTGYTNYISCDTETDSLQTVVKYGRYILGMGRTSIEFFVNSGNPVGSPLSRIQDQSLQARYAKIGLFGGINTEATAVCVGGGSVWFISEGADCGINLHRITGTELQKIENPIIERILTQSGSTSLKYIEWAGITMILISTGSTALVYFPQINEWSRWASASNVNFITLVNDNSLEGTSIRALANNSTYQWSASTPVYQDNGTDITRTIRTSVKDFGTTNKKQETDFRIIGDKTSTTVTISTFRTDDDYVTSTVARTIDMSIVPASQKRNGSFYRRAYILSDTANNAGRIEAIEPWIEVLKV